MSADEHELLAKKLAARAYEMHTGGVEVLVKGARLWIDDVRPTPIGFTHRAETYEEAIAFLSDPTIQWDFVSFDHDLAKEHYSGDFARAKCGYDIARWCEEAAFYHEILPFKWAVHSMNPTGRARIEATMRSCERFWDNTYDPGAAIDRFGWIGKEGSVADKRMQRERDARATIDSDVRDKEIETRDEKDTSNVETSKPTE